MTGRISELTEMTAVAQDDELEIMDQSGTPNNDSRNMRIKVRNLKTSPITTKTASATLTVDEEVILLNPSTSAMTITLPAASGNTGKKYKFKMISTTGQPVVIDANASETIDGKTTQLMEHYLETMEIICDGSNWHILDWRTPKNYRYIELIDEFSSTGQAEATETVGDLGWAVLIDGTTGDVQDAVDGDVDHLGVVTLGSGTTSGNDWAIILGATAALTFMDFDTLNWSQTMLIRIPTITTITVRLGLAETSTGASWETADNAFFKFDPAVSANWQCVTFASAAETTTTGTAVAAATWYKLKIVKDGNTVRFYLNDVNVANHSTQLPVALCSPALQVQTNTAALRAIEIDYFRFSAVVAR